MDIENMDMTLSGLQNKVSEFTTTTTKKTTTTTTYKINTLFVLYGSIPIIIMIVLYMYKPKFVMKEVLSDDGVSELKINVKNLLITTTILATLIIVAIYTYFYNKNKTVKRE